MPSETQNNDCWCALDALLFFFYTQQQDASALPHTFSLQRGTYTICPHETTHLVNLPTQTCREPSKKHSLVNGSTDFILLLQRYLQTLQFSFWNYNKDCKCSYVYCLLWIIWAYTCTVHAVICDHTVHPRSCHSPAWHGWKKVTHLLLVHVLLISYGIID